MGESMVTRQLELSDRRYWATAATLAALPGLIALINLVVSAYRIWIPSGTSQHDAFAYIGQCAVFILPSVILAPALLLGRLRVAAIWGLGVLMSSAFPSTVLPLVSVIAGVQRVVRCPPLAGARILASRCGATWPRSGHRFREAQPHACDSADSRCSSPCAGAVEC